MQGAMDHLKSHQKYPATKAQLVAECNNLSDFDAEDKKWFMDTLPEGTYNSAEDVTKALGMTADMGGGQTGGDQMGGGQTGGGQTGGGQMGGQM